MCFIDLFFCFLGVLFCGVGVVFSLFLLFVFSGGCTIERYGMDVFELD